MSLAVPQCYLRKCVHLRGIIQSDGTEATERPYCAAFPHGIPPDISYGDNLHLAPVEGDNGIQYEREKTRSSGSANFVGNVWTEEARAKSAKARRTNYHVAIHKSYFPKELHPQGLVDSYVEHWHVLAYTPTEAVNKIWNKHEERLLKLVLPSTSRISLHWGTKKIGEIIGRQSPITVWKREF